MTHKELPWTHTGNHELCFPELPLRTTPLKHERKQLSGKKDEEIKSTEQASFLLLERREKPQKQCKPALVIGLKSHQVEAQGLGRISFISNLF